MISDDLKQLIDDCLNNPEDVKDEPVSTKRGSPGFDVDEQGALWGLPGEVIAWVKDSSVAENNLLWNELPAMLMYLFLVSRLHPDCDIETVQAILVKEGRIPPILPQSASLMQEVCHRDTQPCLTAMLIANNYGEYELLKTVDTHYVRIAPFIYEPSILRLLVELLKKGHTKTLMCFVDNVPSDIYKDNNWRAYRARKDLLTQGHTIYDYSGVVEALVQRVRLDSSERQAQLTLDGILRAFEEQTVGTPFLTDYFLMEDDLIDNLEYVASVDICPTMKFNLRNTNIVTAWQTYKAHQALMGSMG